jgi:hypothetical protein
MSVKAYKNLKTPINTGTGVAEYILVANINDFVDGGIQCPIAPFDGQPDGESVQIKVAHEFKPGRGFARINLAPDKNTLDGKTIGDKLFQKQDFSLKCLIPGSYADVHEQVANMINQGLIVLIKDSNCPANMWYQLGCDCTAAYMSADFSTGTTIAGLKGYTVDITWQNSYVQLYATADGPEFLADAP